MKQFLDFFELIRPTAGPYKPKVLCGVGQFAF